MFHTILVPLDGSPFGEHALPLALTIAQRAGSRLNLVHVCGPPRFENPMHLFHLDSDDISATAHARLYLDRLATSLSARWDVPITNTVLHGPVAQTLKAYTETSGTELAVMTTHGRGALARMTLGSVADELVRSLSLPMLLVRPRQEQIDPLESVHEEACQHMLIPLDGSPLAETALEPAIALGELFNADYTLLQAMNVPMLSYALTAHAPELDQQSLDMWGVEAQAYLDKVAERLRQHEHRVHTAIIIGYPPTAILEYARDHAIELIALTTHGRSGLPRLLLGSTADAVMRESTSAVLISRPPAPLVPVEAGSDEALEYIPI
jgi:nucleotide-binding universal stress UspA family protein